MRLVQVFKSVAGASIDLGVDLPVGAVGLGALGAIADHALSVRATFLVLGALVGYLGWVLRVFDDTREADVPGDKLDKASFYWSLLKHWVVSFATVALIIAFALEERWLVGEDEMFRIAFVISALISTVVVALLSRYRQFY